jgi:hypothetical protein
MADAVVDLSSAHVVAELKQMLRGERVQIAFWVPTAGEACTPANMATLLAEGFRSPYAHIEVWLGEKVAFGTTGGVAGGCLHAHHLYTEYTYDLVLLPGVACSDRMVDILVDAWASHVKYNAHVWRFVLPHEWLLRDYDANDTRTWTHGVTCSQFVLLFLRRCARAGLVQPLPECRNSSTCLPSHIMALLRAHVRPFAITRFEPLPKK